MRLLAGRNLALRAPISSGCSAPACAPGRRSRPPRTCRGSGSDASTLAVPRARSSGDRACASGAQGRWFDSSRAHHDGRRVPQTRMVTWVRCAVDVAKARPVLSSVCPRDFALDDCPSVSRTRVNTPGGYPHVGPVPQVLPSPFLVFRCPAQTPAPHHPRPLLDVGRGWCGANPDLKVRISAPGRGSGSRRQPRARSLLLPRGDGSDPAVEGGRAPRLGRLEQRAAVRRGLSNLPGRNAPGPRGRRDERRCRTAGLYFRPRAAGADAGGGPSPLAADS